MRMDITKIPNDVKSLLNASSRINNFQRAIEELVYNSLDAESSSIAIRVHISKKWIQVVDNGTGIKSVDFELLGERYATSKLLDVKTLKGAPSKYGYQGQALANIIEVSRSVKVTSRYANSDETWTKTFTEGKIIECIKVAQRPSKGTTVEINDFLFNMHIQRKTINPFDELLDIKTFLEQLTLVFNNVSISLRDDSNMEIIFKIHKNRNIYQTLLSLFEVDMTDLKELQVQKNEYKVKAFIGINESEIKNIHWIYLNNRMLYNSNLHTFVNNNFTKTLNLTHKKTKEIKMQGIYKKDDVAYKSIPLYFLFLTCPYNDYDIIYSGKQTTVEFKDWEEIYKLIEKLVKVYKGDISLMNIQKNYNPNEKQVVANVKDTRNEVNKIIAKFLGSQNKKPRVSQMQHGVRGKRIKRKNKKEKRKNTLERIKCKTPYKDILNINKTLHQNQLITKALLNNCVSNVASKSPKDMLYSKNNANQNCRKLAKSSVKCKCFKKDSNLIEIFTNSTDTIKRRCDEVSSNVEYLLNLKSFDNTKQPSANDFINKKCIVTKSIEGEFLKNLNNSEVFIDENSINDPNHRHPSSMNIVKKIRSYDLLQTILNTQQTFYDQNIVKENRYIHMQCSNVYENKFMSRYDFASNLTFESHKYIETFPDKNRSQNLQKSKRSRKFLNINPDMNKENYKNTENLRVKIRKITEKQSVHKNYNLKKNHLSTDNEQLNDYKQRILNSVDISTSDVIGFSKKNRYQTINDMKSQSNNGSEQKFQCQPITKDNIRINLNIENTYTISMESFQNSLRVFNMRKNPKTHRDESVKYISPHNKQCSNDKQVENYKIFEASIYQLPGRASKSTDRFLVDEPIEPLTICEAIISCPDENEENIIEKLHFNNETDSLIIVECNEKSETNISKLQMNVSKNTLDDKNFQGTTTVSYKHVNSCAEDLNNKTYITHNNFTIINRHHFMPKGMSPIFENCFTKNICSYNFDKEYFEDKIYNEFVDKLAINSELFEPKVLNMKDLMTGCIQNITDKLEKRSSDLTFGSESLKSAKVVFGQVDCKFIAARVHGKSHKSSDILVLFDQHAVHERIMLENSLSYYFTGKNWKKVIIDTMSMKISKNDILYLHNHKDKFTRFGLEWTVLSDNEILVNSIPEAIVGRHSRPLDVIRTSVKHLIVEQINTIKCLKGNVSLYPKSVMDLVFSEACRYAIKFGDVLSKKDCDELIVQLATCKTPFQCAHGRPVMAVMMELQPNADKYKFNMDSIKRFKNRIE